MYNYLLRRLWHAVVVVFGVVVIVFFLIRLTGDPVLLYLPPEASQAEITQLRQQLGYDRPLVVQLGSFIAGAVHGDFGESMRYRQPAMAVALEHLPATLKLAGVALALAVLGGIPLGMVAAVRKNSMADLGATTLALLGQCMPTFWLGIVGILVFAVRLRWLPTSGGGGFARLILPGVTLGAYSAGVLVRMVRANMLEVLSQDYVRTARAKGLAQRMVIYKHALKNAAIPTVTILGLQISALIGSAVVTEQVFNYPGVARLAVQAVASRDIPVVQAFVVLTAVLIVAINLVVDMVYVMLDPRISYR